jgi:hypothetical protein
MKQLLQPLLPFFSGLLFGLGLVVSGMTNPSKVQGSGYWWPLGPIFGVGDGRRCLCGFADLSVDTPA